MATAANRTAATGAGVDDFPAVPPDAVDAGVPEAMLRASLAWMARTRPDGA